jgi:LPXTG-motif cell wall-anchored protein
MNRVKVIVTIFCVSLMALVVSPRVEADVWNKKTVVTFDQPVEIPGDIVLPPGTYVFKLQDSLSNRHIVQIFNEDQTHIYATILAIPNYRLQVADETVITFGERAAGEPQALRAWFYPGDNSGQEFVYPKRRALELAQVNNERVQTMPSEPETTTPAESERDEPVEASKDAPLTADKPTGEEVEIAQATPPQPAEQRPDADTTDRPEQLPQTASSLPLFGLIGLLSLGAGFALLAIRKRAA